MRFDKRVAPEFAFYWMMSPTLRQLLRGEKSATTSICAIYQRSLMALPFPLPSAAEQQIVSNKIRRAFEWIDRLASDGASARKLIDNLDHAVLDKAFRGELVPQDATDEPASGLLERIRVDGATSQRSVGARGRPRTTSGS